MRKPKENYASKEHKTTNLMYANDQILLETPKKEDGEKRWS
jgi:hypothetical protein